MKSVTREEMQEIDRRTIEEFGVPALILMEHAGKAVADFVAKKFPAGSKVTVICGKGNNGGDGLVCARHLYNAGYGVKVVVLSDEFTPAPESPVGVNWNAVQKLGMKIMPVGGAGRLGFLNELFRSSDVLVDALFGTGLKKPVEGLSRDVVQLMNETGRPVVAVDIPSGLDCNSGRPVGIAVHARWTVTMGLPKTGFAQGEGPHYTGEVVVADIGLPRGLR